MRRIKNGLAPENLEELLKDLPYSRFLIRQGFDFQKETIDLFGVSDDTLKNRHREAEGMCQELSDCIKQGQTKRALSIVFWIKEFIGYAAYASAGRRTDDERRNEVTNG